MDDDLHALIAVTRPMVKSHIRQTQALLRFLSQLDEQLAHTDTQEGHGNGSTEERQAA